ncbi:MAG: hypothetical protein ACK5OR_07365, partial [Betaproteobacteria bacterium]
MGSFVASQEDEGNSNRRGSADADSDGNTQLARCFGRRSGRGRLRDASSRRNARYVCRLVRCVFGASPRGDSRRIELRRDGRLVFRQLGGGGRDARVRCGRLLLCGTTGFFFAARLLGGDALTFFVFLALALCGEAGFLFTAGLLSGDALTFFVFLALAFGCEAGFLLAARLL